MRAAGGPGGTARVEIEGRGIGSGQGCLVIAEVGVNHDGSPERAHMLLELAAGAGADAVKFQTFEPALVASAEAQTAGYQRRLTTVGGQRDLLAGLALPSAVWPALRAHARERGLLFLSTAFDLPSARLLADLGVPAFKVPSGELTNLPFVRVLADYGRPLLISTGMAVAEEVAAALTAAAHAPSIALFHCVSAYPADPAEANLAAIPAMATRFGVPIGWSDHTLGSVTAVAAVALGAALVEKHVTDNPDRTGPDHAASAGPDDFAAYVAAIRTAERALGDGVKQPTPSEWANRDIVRRSWHTTRDLRPGDRLTEQDMIALRPATGVSPATDLVGRRLRREVASGSVLRMDDLD